MNNPLEMTAAYLEGKLNETQVAAFEAWLRKDRDRANAFVRQAMLDSHLTELMHEQNVVDISADLSDDSHFGTMLVPQVAAASSRKSDERPPIHLDSNKLSRQQYTSAMSYVIKHTFTPMRIAIFATAAALMLGVVLAIVMLSGTDDTDPLAVTPNNPDRLGPVAPDTRPTVATITATHNATWSSTKPAGDDRRGPDPRRGSPLHPGDRLTLTAGFAEITTEEGAVVILEAPTTVELLDNANALRLHTGKLVGICETRSSKGFTVTTPNTRVVDVGTEFGVWVQNDRVTDVQVFQGEVWASRLAERGQPVPSVHRYTTGQAARFDSDQSSIRVGMASVSDFVRRIEQAQADRPVIISSFEAVGDGIQPFDPTDGLGWAGPWQLHPAGHSAKLEYRNAAPMAWNSDRYLGFIFTNTDNSDSALGLRRSYDSASGIDLQEPHVIRFNYRLDTPLPDRRDNDKIAIFDGTGEAWSSSKNTWSLHGWGGTVKGNAQSNAWVVYDGDGDLPPKTTDWDRLISTGVPIVVGRAYEIEVAVYPKEAEWSLVISHEDQQYDSDQALGRKLRFRMPADRVYGVVNFSMTIAPGANRAVSIDEVRIEPLSNREGAAQ